MEFDSGVGPTCYYIIIIICLYLPFLFGEGGLLSGAQTLPNSFSLPPFPHRRFIHCPITGNGPGDQKVCNNVLLVSSTSNY